MRTTIIIPDDLFSAADALAGRLGMSRNELYASAVADLVARHTADVLTARLDQIYGTQRSAPDPPLRRAQRNSLGGGAWWRADRLHGYLPSDQSLPHSETVL